MRRLVYLCVWLALPCWASNASGDEIGSPRKWASRDGRFSVTATLAAFTPDGLQLKTETGRSVVVPLKKLSADDQEFARAEFVKQDSRPSLGFTSLTMAEARQLFKQSGAPPPSFRYGACVTAVVDGSPADIAGIRALDVITHVGEHSVRDPQGVFDAAMTLTVGEKYPLKLRRPQQQNRKITWTVEEVTASPVTAETVGRLVTRQQQAEAKKCPLEIVGHRLRDNSIGLPELSLRLNNIRDSAAVAYVIEADCYNNFGDKVRSLGQGSHTYRGIGQTTIAGNDSEVATWQLSLYDTTTKAVVRIVRVKLRNGVEWNDEDGAAASVVVKMAE